MPALSSRFLLGAACQRAILFYRIIDERSALISAMIVDFGRATSIVRSCALSVSADICRHTVMSR